ncbi:MAG: Rpn family recombination-promoting nuclease/putative transposase, partial [Lachnospiraceae bacterium]|nr:Rpn family recombination-promoting nuclease/putative transposase [Lachnospiraceae bacterium]
TLRDNKTSALYSDLLEIQILELKKLPKEVPEDDNVISWMRFFSGKKVEDFQTMANKNEYIGEAYNTLVNLSADEQKRLEYEAREKALRDYNAAISYAQKQGEARGMEIGETRGIEIGEARGIEIGKTHGIEIALNILSMHKNGVSNEEIVRACNVSLEEVERVIQTVSGT